jgi:halocarboxylic acid dehydrogenase DehI
MLTLSRPPGEVIVRPIPEHRADETLGRAYRDLKITLGVPWVGVITQALAYYRSFFLEAWRQFRPTARCRFFERVSDELRLVAWAGMSSSFAISSQRKKLEAFGYSDREIAQIEATLDLFDYGNQKYLILATAVAASLVDDRALGTSPSSDARDRLPRSPISQIAPIPVMVEEHHADADLRALYDDIKVTLNLPFVNSDYKALARWPSYLKLAWDELKPRLSEPPYATVRQSIHDLALEAVDRLPYPYRMDRRAAAAVGMSAVEIDELCRTILLFQWLLSGLILNVSCFKLALAE